MKIHSREPAIVFGGDINGLGIIRNLGGSGIRVYCVTEHVDPAFFSNKCYNHIVLPNYRERSDLVRSFLESFCKKTSSRPVIFPTGDLDALMLSTLANDMKDDYYFVIPRKEIVEMLAIKSKFYRSLAEKSIPHPRVLIPTSLDSMRKIKKEIRYPVYIRPSISPKFAKVFKKKGFMANTEKEIDHYYSLASKHKIEVMFQEIVYGPDTNHYGISGTFDRKGKPLALFGYHRLRGWPVMFGNSSLMESIALSELSDLKNMIVHYLENLGYYGIMDAEFKKDMRDGQFRLLEVNARSWWQNYLPTKCGQNIVLKAYLDAIGENVEYNEQYTSGIKWVDLLGDFRSALQSGEIGRIRWFRSLRNIRAFSFFDTDDLLPFLARPFCLACELLH